MKIPGTPRRMENEFVGVLTHSVEEFGTTFTVTAKHFNSAFANVFGCGSKSKLEKVTTLDNHIRTTIGLNTNYCVEKERVLTPAICSCCGGRIGKDNYCEFCGMRYW